MHILHISDLHYRRNYTAFASDNYERMLSAMTSPLITLDRALDAAFAAHPDIDLLLISGDLCDDGDAEDYRQLRTHLEARLGGIPMLVTLGNHDRKDAFRAGWLCTADDMASVEAPVPAEASDSEETPNSEEIRGLAGVPNPVETPDSAISADFSELSELPYNAVQKLPGLYILSLDSSAFGCSNGCLPPSQLTWLKKQLQEIGTAPSILMTHHHLLGAHESIPPLPEADTLFRLIQDSNIIGIMCGHTHHCFAGYCADKPYYTADGMSFYGTNLSDGRVKFEEKYGYNYYRIENGCIMENIQRTFSNNRQLAVFRF
ncbi:MAG: metallophosphoesterase [Clostridiales bacterium]|nr:metallophosphoesterase [Clostridiales bacterium]